jgi:GntR family histidine utilization transcriptional repressor
MRDLKAAKAMADKADKPLHQRILSDMAERIIAGDWAPGHRIPSAEALKAQYKCSHETISKALAHLARSAMIKRRRKVGTFVLEPELHSAALEIGDVQREVLALDMPYSFKLVSIHKRRSAASRALLQLADAGPALETVSCHFAGDQPFCLEECVINLDAVPEAAAETFTELSPGAWLAARIPWTAAEHRITAAEAKQPAATALGVQPNKVCLVVERRTWSTGRIAAVVRGTYPGHMHRLTARTTRLHAN